MKISWYEDLFVDFAYFYVVDFSLLMYYLINLFLVYLKYTCRYYADSRVSRNVESQCHKA